MLAKLENENLTYAPINFKLENGGIIVNFNKNIDLMKKYGYKEVIDIQPSYDSETHYLTIEGYTETDTEITVNYTINEIEVNDELSVTDRLIIVEETNQIQDEIINIQLMATDELYTIVEPLLAEVQVCRLGGSKMVDMYVVMVQRGLKTIDEVPLRYREEVRIILEQLEK